MQSLDVVFLSRFLFEVLGYINLLVALQPEPLQAATEASQEEAGSGQKQSKKQQKASFATDNNPQVNFVNMLYGIAI